MQYPPWMRAALVVALSLVSGCSSAQAPASCVNPSYSGEYDAASNVGCRLSPEQSAPNPLSGQPGCAASQYLVVCFSAAPDLNPDASPSLPVPPIPTPASSLNCSGAPANTTSNEAFYCCPCAD